MAPVELHVVPRARYAAWLARRYLEATGGGQRGDVATRVVRSLPRRTSGIEYHRLREYEPGDRLRDVDWRHTLKLGELVVKERIDAPEGSVALLVNLVVANPEEADWLAYHIVMSALSAARQGMSTFILAYDERETVLALRALDGREAFQEALRLSTRLAYAAPIERLLAPPDILRLRRTVRRLGMNGGHEDGAGLEVLLRLELEKLEELAHRHPVAYLVRTLVQWGQQGSTIAVVSRWNHDAEALGVMLPWLRSWGYHVVDLLSGKEPVRAPRPQ